MLKRGHKRGAMPKGRVHPYRIEAKGGRLTSLLAKEGPVLQGALGERITKGWEFVIWSIERHKEHRGNKQFRKDARTGAMTVAVVATTLAS